MGKSLGPGRQIHKKRLNNKGAGPKRRLKRSAEQARVISDAQPPKVGVEQFQMVQGIIHSSSWPQLSLSFLPRRSVRH